MKMKRTILFCLIGLIISGCISTQPMNWQATGGSRADATVKLSIQYQAGIDPVLNASQAINEATRKCTAWGYTGAEAFGGVKTECSQYYTNLVGSVCVGIITVTKEYQCTGQGNETTTKPVQQPTSYQQVPAQQYQPVPVAQPQVIQQPIVQPVVEDTIPSYEQTYQQPQTGQSGKDLRSCLALVDNNAIAECVRKAKR